MMDAPLANDAYTRLAGRFARIATVNEAAGILYWDASTMMPIGGSAARGDQLAVLAGIAHGMLVAPDVADELAAAELAAREDGETDPWRAANLRLMRIAHTRAIALPADLVEAMSRANSDCEKVWREARAKSDFGMVRTPLAEVVRLVREAAAALASALGLEPYDALMDGSQRGLRATEIERLFSGYEAFLRDALPRVEELQASRPAPVAPTGPFPASVQEALCRRLSEAAGLDFEHARLDRSAHPFCGGLPSDVRITTRYREDDFAGALMGVLHETGHALYERGLPTPYARQPVGESAGMAIHESQSLIVEMQACRSDAYLAWLAPQLHQAFGGEAEAYAPDNIVRLYRKVERSFIRVDADEMTYPAHVILRFRLERAILSGDLSVPDIPGAWNDGMRSALGIVPPNDALGCLQDIHWYDGLFGYFPNYTLGAMAAAQLMQAARQAEPDLDSALERGDLSVLLGWLRREVHSRGASLDFNALLLCATREPLNPYHLQNHLTQRYLDVQARSAAK